MTEPGGLDGTHVAQSESRGLAAQPRSTVSKKVLGGRQNRFPRPPGGGSARCRRSSTLPSSRRRPRTSLAPRQRVARPHPPGKTAGRPPRPRPRDRGAQRPPSQRRPRTCAERRWCARARAQVPTGTPTGQHPILHPPSNGRQSDGTRPYCDGPNGAGSFGRARNCRMGGDRAAALAVYEEVPWMAARSSSSFAGRVK